MQDRESRTRYLLLAIVLVVAALVLAAYASQHPGVERIATRVLSGLVALALLVQATVLGITAWWRWRVGLRWQAVAWMAGAVVQSLLAILALSLAFPVA